MDLDQTYEYGPVYIEPIVEKTDHPFWSQKVTSLKILWENTCSRNKEVL